MAFPSASGRALDDTDLPPIFGSSYRDTPVDGGCERLLIKASRDARRY
jgi:hypothetical protein